MKRAGRWYVVLLFLRACPSPRMRNKSFTSCAMAKNWMTARIRRCPQRAKRAARLGRILAASGVKAIYTTQYQRTILHAAPVARALNVTPVVHPAGDTPGLLRKIAAQDADDVVLVVGHGNTVPEILKGLGHSDAVKIEETDFDNLFVLVPRARAAPVVGRLKY